MVSRTMERLFVAEKRAEAQAAYIAVTFSPLMAEYQKKGDLQGILELWRRATLKIAVLFFPIFVFLELSAKPFIRILFPDEYVAATGVLMIHLLIVLRSTVATTTVLMVFKKNAFMFKVNAFASATHVVFTVLMYKQFGWLGVPSATVIMVSTPCIESARSTRSSSLS